MKTLNLRIYIVFTNPYHKKWLKDQWSIDQSIIYIMGHRCPYGSQEFNSKIFIKPCKVMMTATGFEPTTT